MKLALFMFSSLLFVLDFLEFLTSPLGIFAGIGLTWHYYLSFLENLG